MMKKLLGRGTPSEDSENRDAGLSTKSAATHREPFIVDEAPAAAGGADQPNVKTSEESSNGAGGGIIERASSARGKPSVAQRMVERSGTQAPAVPRETARPEPPVQSIIADGLKIAGELESAEDLLIAGEVEGTIRQSAERLTIGASGKIKASIHALNLVVEGQVEGNIYCAGSVTVAPTARIKGDIDTVRLSIADGARFSGRIEMRDAD